MRPTKSESDFLYHSRLFQLQVQKSNSNSQKKRKDFIGSHTWEVHGGPGCRKAGSRGWCHIILSWLCCPLWEKPFQVTCSHPLPQSAHLSSRLHHLPAKRKPLFPTCSNHLVLCLIGWFVSMLVKSVHSILLTTAVVPTPGAGHWREERFPSRVMNML